MHRSAEFSYVTRRAVLERGVCEECGAEYDSKDPWEVHHRIYLASEAAKQFPIAMLASLANAELVHRSCHHHIHNFWEEPHPKDIDQVVKEYQVQQSKVFEYAQKLGRPRMRRLM